MQPLYDTIGSSYAATRRADPAIVEKLAEFLTLESGKKYVDVACGTCNYTSAMSARGGDWSGVDVSGVMLEAARELHPSLSLAHGDVQALPYETGTFDGAICTLAIHHFSDLASALTEVCRVIKSGPIAIFTGIAEQMQTYWLCHYFPTMMALSINAMPSRISIFAALESAGFKNAEEHPFFVTPDLVDLFLYSGKHCPELYLDPVVRSNISSFARLCSQSELHQGLEQLKADLITGEFVNIAASYFSETGDYAYVTAHTDA